MFEKKGVRAATIKKDGIADVVDKNKVLRVVRGGHETAMLL